MGHPVYGSSSSSSKCMSYVSALSRLGLFV